MSTIFFFLVTIIPSEKAPPEEAPCHVRILHHGRGDNRHLVDLVGVAAAGQVVDGRGQTLQDGALGLEAAQPLGDLVADVAASMVGKMRCWHKPATLEPGNLS